MELHVINKLFCVFVLAITLMGCAREESIQVEIDNPNQRDIYVNILKKKGIKYEIDKNNIIYIIGETEESLHKKTVEFDRIIKDGLNRELEND